MAGRGFVKLYRDALDHEVFQDEWLWKLFCWCLMKANYEDRRFDGITVPRGSFITGRNSAAEQLQCSPSRVYRGFERLVDMQCIAVKANSKWTRVSVCNYETYQATEQEERTADEQRMNNQKTANEQPKNTTKEIQETKKLRSNTCAPLEVGGEQVAIPAALDTPEVRTALADWLAFKRKKRQGYADRHHVELKLSEFEQYGPLAFVQAVGVSIGNNWSGLFIPASGRSSANRAGPGQTFDPEAAKRDPNYGRM